MKILVLAGGTSTERDVSIVSGTEVCKALRSIGHQAVLLDVFFGKEQVDADTYFDQPYDLEQEIAYIKSFNPFVAQAVKEKRDMIGPNVLALAKAADVVFLALHGTNGEDGRVQAFFDLHHVPYTGTGYLSSAIAMDKGLTKKIFAMKGVPSPKGCGMRREEKNTDIHTLGMEFPVVVKTCCGGSSIGVYIVHNQEEYEAALEGAFSYEDEIIIEEYICGREFSVGVVDGEAYPVIELEPIEGFYDYKNKYQAGAVIETCPAKLTEEQTRRMQEYARKGCEALGIEGYARLDFMMREDGSMYCLEANTLPGMTPTSLLPQEAAVLGIDYAQLCEKLIGISLRNYNNR